MGSIEKGNPLTFDYATLRQEGLHQLERLAGSEWTDFNEHDPGITILEQYCYALTELIYRCDFPLPDLLSRDGKDPYASLFNSAQILTSHPVTLTDLRKLAIDVRGVKNAWIEKVGEPSPVIFHNSKGSLPLDHQKNLIQLQDSVGSEPVKLKGLYRVLIETASALGIGSAEVIRNVAARLHAHRPLGMDFESVEVLDTQKIQVQASIEVGSEANPEDIMVAILGKIAAQISPNIPFYTLAQRLAAGRRIEEIFDGPMLTQGFIDTDELTRMERKIGLRVSDFIGAIMDVAGVLMVKHLALSDDGGVTWEDWWLNLIGGKTPIFDIENSALKLEKQQIEVNVDYISTKARYWQAQTSLAYRLATPDELNITPPAGRDRRVERYYSAQYQFPAVYGLGEVGLSPQANKQRQGQRKQLQAYLLFFDQLLANQFAQLAHIRDLLGFDADNAPTYFAADIDDPTLGVDAIWRQQEAKTRRVRLSQIVENPATAVDDAAPQINWGRKNRFLDHLLARFAEQFTDYTRFRQDLAATPTQLQGDLARDKQTWLHHYPQLSASRGTGFNALLLSSSGLEQRLRLKLGLPPDTFYLIEHILLRPLDADRGQLKMPLLADTRCVDPYSLQISLVFLGEEVGSFRRFVEQTVREEAPAHLLVYLRWLNKEDSTAFTAAYQTWLESQRTLREGSDQKALRLPLGSEASIRLGFRLRDARDRLIDLLAIGHTYPLADLPVSSTPTVAWGQSGRVVLISSQPGVFYQLLGKDDSQLEPPVETYGDGSDRVLLTPKITKDIGFKLKASKPHSQLAVMLFQAIDIKVGLDTHLQATILNADLLNPTAGNPGPTDPRIVHYGAAPHIEIQDSQAGVDYRLVRIQADSAGADYEIKDSKTQSSIALKVISSAAVRGDSHAIKVQALPALEDTDIYILAIKQFDPNDQQQTQHALLDIMLPLKVRANPALSVAVVPPLLDYRAGTTVVVKGSQASARYQILARPIRDSEFVRDGQNPSALPIDGMVALQVKNPLHPMPDVAVLGEVQVGNGADLALPIDGLKADTLIVVEAVKLHKTQDGKPDIQSSLQLKQAVAVLVRPGAEPDFPLGLKIKGNGVPAGSGLQQGVTYTVLNGQSGVFYHFRRVGSSDDLGLPVYFHKADKGISGNDTGDPEGLQIEVDFSITHSLPNAPPEWDCPADVDAAAKLSIRAVKAQTGLEVIFERTISALLTTT